MFLLYKCIKAVTVMAIASASPCPEVVKSTSFKEYTINIPNTDRGKAVPRYTTKLGSFELFEKIIKGRNLHIIVPAAQSPMIMHCSARVKLSI